MFLSRGHTLGFDSGYFPHFLALHLSLFRKDWVSLCSQSNPWVLYLCMQTVYSFLEVDSQGQKNCHWVGAIRLMGWALFTEFRLGNFRLLHLARSEGLRSCPQIGVNYCMVQWVVAFHFTHTQEVLPVSRSILAKGAVVSDSMDGCRDFPFHFQETVVSSSRTIHRHSSSLDPYNFRKQLLSGSACTWPYGGVQVYSRILSAY